MNQSPSWRARYRVPHSRYGFSLIELLVTVGIIVVLLGVTVVAAGVIRDSANATRCKSNLRQILVGMLAYAADHDTLLPGPAGVIDPPFKALTGGYEGYHRPVSTGWAYKGGYLPSAHIWICPCDNGLRNTDGSDVHPVNFPAPDCTYSYTCNSRITIASSMDNQAIVLTWSQALAAAAPGFQRRLGSFKRPGEVIVFGEENTGLVTTAPAINDAFLVAADTIEGRHMRRMSSKQGIAEVVFLDGHVGSVKAGTGLWSSSQGVCADPSWLAE